MVDALYPDVADLCLVSAYDVAKGHAPQAFEALANIVVLDSGLYETTPAPVAVDAYLPRPSGASWSREEYRRLLAEWAPRFAMTNAVVVSYDTHAPLLIQVDAARVDFAGLGNVATDFLMKPVSEGQFHSSFELGGASLGQFDILGVTERELGPSAVARCRALVRLRKAMVAAQLDLPIHVFGSITPAAVACYFLCGADVFDGLNWLRASLDQPWAVSQSEFAVAHGHGHLDDGDVQLELWRRNLRTLRRTQSALRRFSADGDKDALMAHLPFAGQSLELARAAIAAEEA